MDKAAILAALTASGEINTFRATDNWRVAFSLYNAAHPGSHKNPNCGSCFKDVRTWLQS